MKTDSLQPSSSILQTFFQKFDLFADAPNAVARMRELVLELAVRGKLVVQNATDEPAHTLLERIRKTKERLISERAIRRQDTDPLGEDEAPFSIPESWVWTRLGEIGDWGSGSTPARGNHELYGGGIAWLKSGELNDNQALTGSEETITELAVKTCSFRQNQPGDVLLAMYGATIGKVAILAEPAVTNQAVCGCTPLDGVSTRYLFSFLVSQRSRFHAASEGGAQPNISKVKIVAFPIPLPPLAEQKRIVAKVDALMGLCDRLEAQQQEREEQANNLARASLARFAEAPTPANLNLLFPSSFNIQPSDLRKSILTLAVQGKLVPQDPNDEPAEELLARIARKRTELLKAAYPNRDEASTQMRKQEAQLLPDGLESLAPGWSWATLIQASLLVVDCHNKTAPYVQSGIRLLRTTNIRDGLLNLTEPKFVDDATYERWSARCKPEPGDVLITREAPMGEVCIIPEGMKVCLGQRMMLIRLVPGTMDQKYLLYSLMAPDLMERVQDKPVGATVQHLRVGGVETLLTPVPPLAEQRRIVAKVSELMALVDELETQLAASRATAEKLLNALVAELTGNPSLPTSAS
jgi:type I restriction enzyme S subunit